MTPSFRRALAALSKAEQRAARRAYGQFADNPSHPSLQFKKLAGQESCWSVRVTISVRAVGVRQGDAMTWVWIGSHGEFDNRFG